MAIPLHDTLGILAGTLTTIAFVPQVVRTWRTGSARDLSVGMLATFTVGVVLWLAYGLVLQAVPIIVANVVTLGLVSVILAFKIRELRTRSGTGDAAGGPPRKPQ